MKKCKNCQIILKIQKLKKVQIQESQHSRIYQNFVLVLFSLRSSKAKVLDRSLDYANHFLKTESDHT